MSATSTTTVEQLAADLYACEQAARGRRPLATDHPHLTVEDAYAVQDAGRALRASRGPLVGHKVGLTSAAMQEMLGVDQPDAGFLLESMVARSPARLERGALVAPRVEAEIAFVLREGLSGPTTVAEVMAAASHVVPAVEVIDSRIADWKITIVDTVADNASCASVVIGEPVAISAFSTDDLAALVVTIVVGDEQAVGDGAAVMGHPAAPVAWLAEALQARGQALAPGALVLPGAVARALPIERGDLVRADFGPLGAIEVEVT